MAQITASKRGRNHIDIEYCGQRVASGIDYGNGWYEVRPYARYFQPLDRMNKMMNEEQIEELCERSYARYYATRERYK